MGYQSEDGIPARKRRGAWSWTVELPTSRVTENTPTAGGTTGTNSKDKDPLQYHNLSLAYPIIIMNETVRAKKYSVGQSSA